MLNLSNQTKLWLAILLLATAPLIAQQETGKSRPQKSFEQGPKLTQSQLMPGYNAPASIQVVDSWDVYATASYIYWQAQQENIEIGMISKNVPEGLEDTPFTTNYKNNISVTNPNFTYRPGFKFGIGANLNRDDWDVFAEYTWFHGGIGSGVTPLTPNTSTTSIPNGEYLFPLQGQFNDTTDFFKNADQAWRLKIDFLDLSIGRSYYSGTRLAVKPFFGARGAWIRQALRTTYSAENIVFTNTTAQQAEFNDSSTSWGVGPRAGVESSWLLGYGVRLIGNGSADILYTRYETQSNDQGTHVTVPTVNPIAQNISISQTVDYLRTHVSMEMGFGWGSYFDNDNWHIDLSANYGFQIFWNQNMFRNFENTPDITKSFAPNGNLYIHGLTVNGRLDF